MVQVVCSPGLCTLSVSERQGGREGEGVEAERNKEREEEEGRGREELHL